MTFFLGSSKLEKIAAIFFRLFGCNHPDPYLQDLGDEEHRYMYCFRCQRRVN